MKLRTLSEKIGCLGVDDKNSAASFQKTAGGGNVSVGGDKPPQPWGKFNSTKTKAVHKRS